MSEANSRPWPWRPDAFPQLPQRLTRVEVVLEGQNRRLEELEELGRRALGLGWLIVAELALLVAGAVAAAMFAL